MLTILVPQSEQWDENTNSFVYTDSVELHLEHSLLSLSEWESKWKKPFFTENEKTREETVDYIRCMTLNSGVDDNVYNCLSNDNVNAIKQYIKDPMTATWFTDEKKGNKNGEQVTAELIYYWMISLNIPSEWESRHINKLLTLIKVCNNKNQPGKKMSMKEIASQNAALNAARRKRFNKKGR